MVTQVIDNISFQLKEPHDFSSLSKYGKMFCVFDQNDSGNISFGMSTISDFKIEWEKAILFDYFNTTI
jgi:serine/threonine-protein kinase